jgi:hypothetical protein
MSLPDMLRIKHEQTRNPHKVALNIIDVSELPLRIVPLMLTDARRDLRTDGLLFQIVGVVNEDEMNIGLRSRGKFAVARLSSFWLDPEQETHNPDCSAFTGCLESRPIRSGIPPCWLR